MEEKMQGIRASDLVVGYEGKSVLKDVNFWVRPGQILTLIGPNGSGKSTLLKSITRQLKTIAGQVYLAEGTMDAYTDAALAKQMAMVTTERISPELMTCRDVVATGRYPYTGRFGVLGKEDEEKVQKALESLHALEVADRLFAKVSDGQRQRVMLARAICQEPKILILDEPTSYLDMHYKLEILQSIRNMVKEENLAVVMSLHELDLAQKVSDLVACVDGETLAKIGRPEEIFCGDTIACLYGVNSQAYDVVSGSMFLQKAKGEPKVFVIGGGGSGIAAYYTLQRDQIPFAAGILSEGDVEYKAAKALASALVTTPAFYPIEIRQMAQARKWIDDCDYCICTLDAFGPLNQANKELLSYAKEQGKWIREGEKPWQK
ncbi:ABC transporter ATP-binding protein [Roseburia sp. AM51-8]|uniref:ABC transporter ATP-binding protein n=1 Tax=Roseburia sp. AM51-8 TaxID=2292366 RepID=UPI001FA98934|nr:ABC transporter ATP-binding protein [Roseburia sp. AM51-8]